MRGIIVTALVIVAIAILNGSGQHNTKRKKHVSFSNVVQVYWI